jgi:hypothetical protein
MKRIVGISGRLTAIEGRAVIWRERDATLDPRRQVRKKVRPATARTANSGSWHPDIFLIENCSATVMSGGGLQHACGRNKIGPTF